VPPAFTYPQKPSRGDAVAIVSPSGRSAARFPEPYELGLRRLREDFGLEPVEYPTTRAPTASPQERARDLEAAFADPTIRAVIASIGGEDELKVLRHLDPPALAADPKPFLGYSDNTNLHLVLWQQGLVSYHGGSVMVQLGRPGSMHPATRLSLERALLGHGIYELEPPAESGDVESDWADLGSLAEEPPLDAAEPWSWHGPATRVTGPGWGGCLEIVDFHLRTGTYLGPDEQYDGAVLFLETSEELPDPTFVSRVLLCMGERGLLQRFAAIIWGRPKAWSFASPNAADEKARYVDAQREAVLAAAAEYHPDVPLVFGIDLGHTDPQYVVPSGGAITVDGARQRLEVTY
jgi:muramoyltetrapeptide carboxypeptidase LdcA involved in peptidoglycan recycling